MLKNPPRILNFDNSVLSQKKLFQNYSFEIIDFTSLCEKARFFMSKKTRGEIKNSLPVLKSPALNFLGSGDFHHISEVLLSQFYEPITLLVFDFHPDFYIFPPHFACGSWVHQVLKNKNITKCVLMGMGSSDLSASNIQSGDLHALEGSRLEIYPYEHASSRVYLKNVPENISIDLEKKILTSKITWKELKSRNLEEFALSVVRRLPKQRVYISIDKDCLNRDFAVTNWEEGRLSLDELLIMLKIFINNLDIAAIDITGDYSEIVLDNIFKAFISKMDHPKYIPLNKTSFQAASAINERTNLKLLEVLYS